MKVYAEFIEDDGLLFRTKTLLQFGDSWDLIGSIVMKNPGGAKPGKVLDLDTKQNILNFYNKELDLDNWSIVSADGTMNDIRPIFNGNYVGKDRDLNGIIQIFNLYNICETSVNSAYLKGNSTNSKYLLPNIESMLFDFRNKPVYLGFSDFYTNEKSNHFNFLQNAAKSIFEYVKNSEFDYLEDDYIIENKYYFKNHFYHPQYLNKPTKREKYLPVLENFLNLYEKN